VAAPIGLVVTGHTSRDAYGYGYGEIWQPSSAPRQTETLAEETPVVPRPAPVAQHTPARPGGRPRTRLSWLR
jgi:hypothetical protein